MLEYTVHGLHMSRHLALAGGVAAHLGNGIETDYVNLLSSPERSDSAANNVRTGAVLCTLASPDSISTQHNGLFGCLSPAWQHLKHGSAHKPAVKREDNAPETQHRWAPCKNTHANLACSHMQSSHAEECN